MAVEEAVVAGEGAGEEVNICLFTLYCKVYMSLNYGLLWVGHVVLFLIFLYIGPL